MFNFRKKNFFKIDIILIITILMLTLLGLIVLNSASLSLSYNPIKSQVIASILGVFVSIIIISLDYDFIKNLNKIVYIISLLLMVLVTLFGKGEEIWGANNWLVLGPIQFQPSEFVKIGMIISFARSLEDNRKNISKPLVLLKVLTPQLILIALIAKEDFGTAFVTTFIIAVMLFSAGLNIFYFVGIIASGILSLPIIYNFLDGYQKDRIKNFLDPSRDIAGTGFQAMQGKIAIGSGKLTGRGLYKGIQTQNNFIPEKQTDYIFPVLAEELGFIGSSLLIALYTNMLYRFVKISENAKDPYGSYLVMGIASMFLIHIFENIGMTIGIMPVTGIPLPFMSHGELFS